MTKYNAVNKKQSIQQVSEVSNVETIKPLSDNKEIMTKMSGMSNKSKYEFRTDLEGNMTEGHWIIKDQIPTSLGFKATIFKNRGLYRIQNEDFGWRKTVPIIDDNGAIYDNIEVNMLGNKFLNENKHGVQIENDYIIFGTAEDAVSHMLKWLQTEIIVINEKNKKNETNNLDW